MTRLAVALLCSFFVAACSCESEKGRGDGGPDDDGSTTPIDGCGDGNLDEGEACDDHNLRNNDGCTVLCAIESGYTCDVVGASCRLCGNAVVEPGETCDDANTIDDGCNATCTGTNPGFTCWAEGIACEECGDSFIDVHETCDDGDADSDDGCSATCQVELGYHCDVVGQPCEVCGDGTLDAYETCDDGDIDAGDGCSPSCKIEPGWDCNDSKCTAAACGDGLRAGVEQCDDGARTSGDGCSYRCTIEPGFICITEGIPCVAAVCGNSAVEAQETCDDGDADSMDGCSATCRIETGYACVTPGTACAMTTCGNGVIEGIETCDDGDDDAGDGCSHTCRIEIGAGPVYYVCPMVGQSCVTTTCGNGQREGSEPCDDGDDSGGDGCSATCTVEPFFECTGSPSVCKKPIEFVQIAQFAAPMAQPQAVHYDPETQSFVAYGFDASQGYQEFCLDGSTVMNATRYRPRDLVGNSLDGAAYDPFTDRFLFIRQNGQLTEIDRTNTVVRQVNLTSLGLAGGIQVGDDGRLFATNHDEKRIYIFARDALAPSTYIQTDTNGGYLDNIFMIPGMGWVGYYNLPPAGQGTVQLFTFHSYDGALVGRSNIPGTLFANGTVFPANADGGEAAVDGGYFLVCSEYLNMPTTNSGICQLFSRRCETDLECANRVPGTSCNTMAAIPYCYAPARARDDFFTVGIGSTNNVLDVLANDQESQAVCQGGSSSVDGVVTPGSRGGTITISNGGADVTYTPGSSFCGSTETFGYTAELVGVEDDAIVTVFVACVCGNGVTETGEQCDDSGTASGDGCSPTCRFEPGCPNHRIDPGEQCDDGNSIPGDGCSPTCIYELE